jgi:hypothetical protein
VEGTRHNKTELISAEEFPSSVINYFARTPFFLLTLLEMVGEAEVEGRKDHLSLSLSLLRLLEV